MARTRDEGGATVKIGGVVKYVDKAGGEHDALVLAVLDHPTGARKSALSLVYVDDPGHYSIQVRVLHQQDVTEKVGYWK